MRKLLLFISFILVTLPLLAQQTTTSQDVAPPPNVIYPSAFSESKPLAEILKEKPFIAPVNPVLKESSDQVHRKHQTFMYSVADGPQYGNDLAVQQTKMGTRDISNKAPLTSWAGQVGAYRPNDPTGAVGPNHYIQIVNATPCTIYSKTGTALTTFALGDLWSPAKGNSGDPIVMYDKYADRWFLSQFDDNTGNNEIYIAISKTSDPTGAYYLYTFTSPEFPDYLKFSIWENGYYMTSNQGADKMFCFERAEMLAGNAAARAISTTFTQISNVNFFCPLPGDAADGGLPPAGTPLPFFAYYDNAWGTAGTQDGVDVWSMTVNWGTTPTASIAGPTLIPTSVFDASYVATWTDVSQPGTAQKLDGIGGVPTFRAQWRPWTGYNSVVLNWGVRISATQRSIRWCELRQNQTTGVWSLYQEGTYTPDAATRWMGSIAMDANGSIGLSYAKSDATSIFPGLYYTGRLATDPLGTMSFTETQAKAGTSSQTSTNRYGDYSHTALDPDGVTFWHTGEYVSSGVKTWIYSFQLPKLDLPPVAYFSANSTAPFCTGTILFTEASANGPTSWFWDFGDGTTATDQNPSHTYAASGIYTVSLIASNAFGSDTLTNTNYISINIAAPPVATDGSRCGTGTVVLNATGNNTIRWYDVITGGTALGTGNSYTTPSISTTTTYYVSNIIQQPSLYVGPAVAGAASTNSSYLTFDCYTPVVLVSVAVNNAGAAGNRTIQLQNSVAATLITQTVYVPAGNSRITLNWNIPAGTDMRLVTPAGSSFVRKTTGVVWPYTSAGLISIKSCSAGATRYTSYFDWEIQEPSCPSTRVPCVATINSTVTPIVSIAASATTVCEGTPVTFTASPTNGGTPTYQWQVNGVDTGPNSAEYTNATLAQGSTVNCIMTSTADCATPTKDTSNVVTMTVNPTVVPAVTITASETSICAGTLVDFTATPTNGGTPAYQWEKNGIAVGTGETYSSSALVQGDIITCVMTSDATCASVTAATSNPVTMTVSSATTPAVSISASTTNICIGTLVDFTATPTNGGTPIYEWRLNGGIVGANSATYSNAGLADGDVVTCLMRATSGCTSPDTAISNAVTISVSGSYAPVVSISASATSICVGTSVSFVASPTNGGTPTYQWHLNGGIIGSNSPTFSSSALSDGDVVNCIMSSSLSCASPHADTSNMITITVGTNVAPLVSVNASATSICSGTNVTFTAQPTNGGTPTYQWTLNGSNVGTGSAVFSTTGLANNDIVSCIMTSSLSCASPTSATAEPITISVNPSATPVVIIGASETTICEGTSVTFNATALYNGTPNFQWLLNNNPVGSNSALYTNATMVYGDIVSCQATFSGTCVSSSAVTSNAISIVVKPNLSPSVDIASNPAGVICPGTVKVFTPVSTNGGNSPSYSWTVDGTVVSIGPSFSGAFTNGQIINVIMTSDADCVNPLTAEAMPIYISMHTVIPVVVTLNAGTLTSSAVSGNQWYEQTTGYIAGAVFQNYTPPVNGNYYTIVSDNSDCLDTSNIVNVNSASIAENADSRLITFYPNPTNGLVEVTFSQAVTNGKLLIENALGQKVYEENLHQLQGSRKTIDFSKYASGVYFVVIRDEKMEIKEKILFEK